MMNTEVKGLDKMNPIERIKNLFLNPKKLMDYVEKEATITFPMLIIIIMNFLIVGLKFNDFKELVREQLQGNGVEVTDKIINVTALFTPIITVLSLVISILILSIVFFAFSKVLKGKISFKQCISVVTYSSVVNVIGVILLFVISLITGSFKFSTNINIFDILNVDMSTSFIYTIFNYITISNILSLWQHVLIAIGITKISGINKKYVYIFTALVYLVSVYMI